MDEPPCPFWADGRHLHDHFFVWPMRTYPAGTPFPLGAITHTISAPAYGRPPEGNAGPPGHEKRCECGHRVEGGAR